MKRVLVFLFLLLRLAAVYAQYPAPIKPAGDSLSMKTISDWMQAAGEATSNQSPFNVALLNQQSHLPVKTVPYSLSDWYGYGLAVAPVPFTTCGAPFVVAHVGGTVAAVSKTVSYGTVTTSLTGSPKCWITQNLGADQQATSATDASEASAGWYWQFNRPQGYKVADDGVTRTPATTWNATISETSDWIAANDPCALLLGSGWRIPTNTEWANANSFGGWYPGYAATYASVLKIHAAGDLPNNGAFFNRGNVGIYWGSSQASATNGGTLTIYSNFSIIAADGLKACGFTLRCLNDFASCGSPMVLTHTAGTIAPVTKTVTYGTVATNLSGTDKCWITQNLGADHQATSATDATEPSAGWYWQFNRVQGYKNDGTTRTPATTWITTISESSDWVTANDPCALLLGSGWRIPTYTEWNNTNATGGWSTGFASADYASVLKLHQEGYLDPSSGVLYSQGGGGNYQSSTQNDITSGWGLSFNNTYSSTRNYSKAYAFSIRCLKDLPTPFTTCGNAFTVNHAAGTIAPVTKTVTYGTVMSGLSGAGKCWITQNLGADHQATSATDATEASAGWYWQFNRMQGYKMADDGVTRTPATTWITSINETSDWVAPNDPCARLLGSGWRIPTQTEWINTNTNGAWANFNTAYASVLKLHAAGDLYGTSGALSDIGNTLYWSSSQASTNGGLRLYLNSASTSFSSVSKSFAFPLRCLQDISPAPFTNCGSPFAVTHTAGSVAPVTKTVSYGTVTTGLSGASKCWITQNLGADQQAISATDATEASAGWYWQFNRTQGFKMADDGVTRTPSTAWDATNDATYAGWDPAKDPCILLLGAGWRLPTSSEWANAIVTGGWSTGYLTSTYASALKLHAAGYLNLNTGVLNYRGSNGIYWSSTQYDATFGMDLALVNSGYMSHNAKSDGWTARCLKDLVPVAFTSCGNAFVVTHTALTNGAPVTKTISYGTVLSSLSGASKCWITQNLGADQQATSATDATEASAGWYWQFNLPQGYKNDGTTLTPATTSAAWVANVSGTTDWLLANDPCAIQLGSGWRLPTQTEWTNANTTGGWATGYLAAIYTSPLKLHAAGFLNPNSGLLLNRNSTGAYWSSTQSGSNAANGWYINCISSASAVINNTKANGLSVRCIQDPVATPFTTCGNTFVVTHTAGTVAPVNKTVSYGTVMTSLSGAPKCWITQNLGADNQAISVTDSSENAAGWYWQFNRAQGYRLTSDGVRTPATAWNTISESSDWLPANDPCALSLGTGWRIPTYSEWTNANTSLSTGFGAYASMLKLHSAGDLNNGSIESRGAYGFLWSSTQFSAIYGGAIRVNNASVVVYNTGTKTYGVSLRCLRDPDQVAFTSCGNNFVVTHTAGANGAPVTKTVTYGTVATNLTGSNKCWITQNLGADNPANSATDTREIAAGWYWQFNRMQGYKMADDGTTRTPATAWITSISENSDWLPANDPCALQLGVGWRIPTDMEWTNANTAGGWNNVSLSAIYSLLKLHVAGDLDNGGGALVNRGTVGYYWSSVQSGANSGWYLNFSNGGSGILGGANTKTFGYPLRCLKDLPVPFTTCGNNFVVVHTAGTVAPVNKSVVYGTVLSSLSGASKCWITQNLGADQQATSATDATEASAGWYWQFNLPQGYKMPDGKTLATDLVPATTASAWAANVSGTTDWDPAKDPCTLLLGTGWRLPTNAEWTSADATGGWTSYTNTFASPLKLHAAGYLLYSNGTLTYRGSTGSYWSSTQTNASTGYSLNIFSGYSYMYSNYKAYGFFVRCLRDPDPVPFTTCGAPFVVTHTAATGGAPVTKTVSYGTVTSSLSGASKCWITQNLGADQQATSATDATEASAGWYWQFNRMQGYKMADDGTRTPATTWITSISENSDWMPANDPCTLQLGNAWRLPTNAEWTSADATGGWTSYTNTFASPLKLHVAGALNTTSGALIVRGASGMYWCNTQLNANYAWNLGFDNASSAVFSSSNKTYGFPVRCLKDPEPTASPFTTCGNTFVVTHTAGTIAPVTKTVTYGTVSTNISGTSKCWITQNLGADRQATAATDATEISSGWYWQFNRPQGFKMADDGATRSPATTWVTSISESSDWVAANDPCTLLLGSGWRIPTSSEWKIADTMGLWNNYTDVYNSVLKLHAAGYLDYGSGSLYNRSSTSNGYYWSSTQFDASNGRNLHFSSGGSLVDYYGKADGFSVRCLRDPATTPFTTCGSAFVVAHTAGTVAPVTKTVSYGTVESDLSGDSKCWITQNLGADRQATSATDTTEASSGWYWQFNRMQGYKIADDNTLTPAGWASTAINESTDWSTASDPCTQLLGTGWRLPTNTEWMNADATGGWANYTNGYTSALKLHAGGMILNTTGAIANRGSLGYFWSTGQSDATNGNYLGITSTTGSTATLNKASGLPVRCLKDLAPAAFTSCGNPFVVTHTAGNGIAPVTKTVTYGTVTSSLSGAGKCWITQNLGADRQAVSATDVTEASAGWYWQFNRMQGYKMTDDGVTRTPAITWDATNDATYTGWNPAKDPCTLLLGPTWRLPTNTEWTNANTSNAWASYTTTYASVLKLHAAGYLSNSNAAVYTRGSGGFYWSSIQSDASNGWGLNFAGGTSSVTNSLKAYGFNVRCLKDFVPVAFTTCGNAFVVTHTAGAAAPVTKTVSYGTVMTNLSGTNKCWITQNLGADNQAASATDATEASSGWYWQFNRQQGFKMADDGVTRTPATAWITPISENSDWLAANDPCTLLLGAGWRIPTRSEWTTAYTSGGWSAGLLAATFASPLKLHAAGYLFLSNATLTNRGAGGLYWSSTQNDIANSSCMEFSSSDFNMLSNSKAFGFSQRCLKDATPVAFTTCGNTFIVTHKAGTVAPVTKTVSYGTVTTSLSGVPKCWITQNLGADNQASSATDASESSAGWYWQFNRPQGYKMADDGFTRTPATSWIWPINETGDWAAANDPCTLLLGSGWRIPTNMEWMNANAIGGWSTGYAAMYASILKVHIAGFLDSSKGNLLGKNTQGGYWTSTQSTNANGMDEGFTGTISATWSNPKSYGMPLRCLRDSAIPFTTCGSPFVVTHTAGIIAPVTKTVTYGTVTTNLSGVNKCWITQNLGSDHQATSATDVTEASAGWYWQFNRTQGYKVADDNVTRTPATTWIAIINETSDWLPANDPCTQSLGSGWRIPTISEWANVIANGSWNTGTYLCYSSELKLHVPGYIFRSGILYPTSRGLNAAYWSSTQVNNTNGWELNFFSTPTCSINTSNTKNFGFSLRCLKDLITPFTTCGNSFVVTHTAGTIAPVTKTVTYGTVTSALTGTGKCWITQNLGADHQATAATDATEASAGWYWQFNRQQGYKMADDGITRTPSSAWNSSISETSDWVSANDPCAQLLGSGWRIPTYTEWNTAKSSGGWSTGYSAVTYASPLKLHAAGYIGYINGPLVNRSSDEYYWSSTQYDLSNSWYESCSGSVNSNMYYNFKSYGFSVRCLWDFTPVAFTTCGNPFIVTHTGGTNGAPSTKTVNYSTVTSALGGTGSKCWITQNLGADNQAASSTDATDASAGWYWQFNRKQGYSNTATATSPAWTITSISESSDWLAANDPCALQLGTNWRLPTYAEWTSANTTWGGAGYAATFGSALKLHAAGYIINNTGKLGYRGSYGDYWSSTQYNSSFGGYLNLYSGVSNMSNDIKAYGFSVRCLKDLVPVAFTTCGNPFVITHTAGTIAPATKTVSYGTVLSSLSGASKCWITQNLGSDQQASSATDATEASSGWYWQFNRKQGYKMADDGTTRTPATAWIASISETSDWLSANDPCTQLLGSGWRIPTYTEWTNVNSTWGAGYDAVYASQLKLHAAGLLLNSDGTIAGRNSFGYYWSSTQKDAFIGSYLHFRSGGFSDMNTAYKAYAFPVRCFNDLPVAFTTCGNYFVVTHTAGTIAPVTKTVTYGTVASTLSGTNKCWITQNLGADHQATSVYDSTEASAGWYWQFNRPQGYKNDGTTLSPTWNAGAISETSDWIAANDPCTQLSSNWRLPTATEWNSVNTNGGWSSSNFAVAYASVLKLHAAGSLNSSTGVLGSRGIYSNYWSSTQSNTTNGMSLNLINSGNNMNASSKTSGFSVRCLSDICIGTVTAAISGGTSPIGYNTSPGVFTATGGGGSGAYTYLWYLNGTTTGVTTPTYDPGGLTAATTIYCIVTSGLCGTATTSATSITVNPMLTAVASGGTTSVNYNTSPGTFTATAGGGTGSYTYLWYLNGASTGITTSTYTPGNLIVTSDIYCAITSGVSGTVNTPTIVVSVITSVPFTVCGAAFVLTHTAATGGAPITKIVNYATVASALGGTGSKCWITQNLGADNQAISGLDATDAAAGWFWQFNRPQGYSNIANVMSPAWTITSISEASDWLIANDPCAQLLGNGWRLPTQTEWTNVNTAWSGLGYPTGWNSSLKLHAAGYLYYSNATLTTRGGNGAYWSSSQADINGGWVLYFSSGSSGMSNGNKANGFSARCLKD